MGTTTPPDQVDRVEDLISTEPDRHPGDGDFADTLDEDALASVAGSFVTASSIPPAGVRARARQLGIGTMVGAYRITAKLGQGGMGEVYAAQHPLIGKKAAIKVLRPNLCADIDAVERFVQEARAVNQIGHPNIVDIFAFGADDDGRSYLVMEMLHGESLQARLRRAPVGREELCYYGDAIARALGAAHEKGIIHRDLKPENVFLHQVRNERPIVKLLDFGLAKLSVTEDNRMEKTRTGTMMGTPQYISPEQARGYEIDARADIYSFGVMLFELATGRPPFLADNAMDMVAQHLYQTPPRVRALQPAPMLLDDLVAAMMSKDPTSRPSLDRVREVLELVRTMPDVTISTADITVPAIPRVRRRVATAVIAVLAAGAGAGTFLAVRAMRDEPAATVAPKPPVAVSEPAKQPVVEPPVTAPAVAQPARGEVHVRLERGVKPGRLVVDGEPRELGSSWDLMLAHGEHELVLQRDDETVWTRTIQVTGAEIAQTVMVPAKPAPAPAKTTRSRPIKRPTTGGGSGGSSRTAPTIEERDDELLLPGGK